MSMKRLAILATVGHGGLNGTNTLLGANMTISPGSGGRSSPSSLHGNVNVLLGGAMLSGVILVVFLVCYCCHKNMRKNTMQYSSYWREPEVPLEVFTVPEAQQCYESGLFELHSIEIPRPPTPGPPPAYDSVVAIDKDKMADIDHEIDYDKMADNENNHQQSVHQHQHQHPVFYGDDTGLPTYEAALRLEAGGYV